MDREQATQMVQSLRDERSTVATQVEELRRRLSGLDKVIDGIEELFPDLIVDSRDSDSAAHSTDATLVVGSTPKGDVQKAKPQGQKAVLQVLMDRAPEWMTVEDLTADLEQRNWLPDSERPVEAVRTSTFRLKKSDPRVVRERQGRSYAYRFLETPETTEAPDESEASMFFNRKDDDMPPP